MTPIALSPPEVTDIVDTSPKIRSDAPRAFPFGTTIVTWIATDFSGNSITNQQFITIIDPLPTKPNTIIDSADTGEEGSLVTFSAIGSVQPEGHFINSYEWDFGDGAGELSAKVAHIYDDDGNYVVTLTVIDVEGLIGKSTKKIQILNVPPSIREFNADKETIDIGDTVNIEAMFEDRGESDTHTVEWYLGGENIIILAGVSSDPQHESFTFNELGTYKITFVVRDDDNGVAEESIAVIVNPLSTPLIPHNAWLFVAGAASAGGVGVGGYALIRFFKPLRKPISNTGNTSNHGEKPNTNQPHISVEIRRGIE